MDKKVTDKRPRDCTLRKGRYLYFVVRFYTPNKRDTSNLREICSAFSAESVSTHPPVYICPYSAAYIPGAVCICTSRGFYFHGDRRALAGDCKKSTALRAAEFFFRKVKPNVTGVELIAGARVITTAGVCPKAHTARLCSLRMKETIQQSLSPPRPRAGVCALSAQVKYLFSLEIRKFLLKHSRPSDLLHSPRMTWPQRSTTASFPRVSSSNHRPPRPLRRASPARYPLRKSRRLTSDKLNQSRTGCIRNAA